MSHVPLADISTIVQFDLDPPLKGDLPNPMFMHR